MRKWMVAMAALCVASAGCGKDAAKPTEQAAAPTPEGGAAPAPASPAAEATGDTIKVGILHSLSGTMAISETSLISSDALQLNELPDGG